MEMMGMPKQKTASVAARIKGIRPTIKFAVLFVYILLIGFFGAEAKERNETRRLESLAPLKAQTEYIKTSGLIEPPVYTVGTIPRGSNSYWVAAETKDWLLLNGKTGTVTCHAALDDFAFVNIEAESLSLREIQQLAASGFERKLELQVLVPRFKEAPAKLQECAGISYDHASGMLKSGTRTVAYLTKTQPRLALSQ